MRRSTLSSVLSLALTALLVGSSLTTTHAAAAKPCSPTQTETWNQVGVDSIPLASGLIKSQGITALDDGWAFSWQGGLETTDDDYATKDLATIPADTLVEPTLQDDNTLRSGGNHIGDIDAIDGIIYAPIEDGEESLGVTNLNSPEYQRPYLALFDAATLTYTGTRYAMPLELHAEGIPWVAINDATREVYTAEWDMPNDRINVFDLDEDMAFVRFIDLVYPSGWASGAHLTRIQGAEVFGNALYAARDNATATIYRIDLTTGAVTEAFSMNPPAGVPAEVEGIAVRNTPDGATLHVSLLLHNDIDESFDFLNFVNEFRHFAITCE